jgi:hypothetical protein
MMNTFFKQRWPWFLLGLILLPAVSLVRGVFEPLSAKAAMPFESVREECTRTFRGDADYSYTLRSRATKDEFAQFVKAMKMEGHRISDERYEKKTENGRLVTTISYADGWITYEEVFV